MKQRAALLKKIREQLIAKQQEFLEVLEQLSEDRREVPQVRDSADEASSSTMSKMQSSLEETEIHEIKLIEDALERMDRGEYGICVDCGEPISTKRLEAFPYAPRCISCQEALEE